MIRLSLIVPAALLTFAVACGGTTPPRSSADTSASSVSTSSAVVELRLVADPGATGLKVSRDDGTSLVVDSKPLLTSADIAQAEARGSDVNVTLTPAAAKTLQDATARMSGKKIAIVVNGVAKEVVEIKSEIDSGRVQISLRSPDEATDLAQRLSKK